MSTFNFIRNIISPLIFLNVAKQYGKRAAFIKIKAAQVYVQGAQKVRILFIGSVLTLFSFVFLVSGLNLVHTALFTYSNLSLEVKFVTAFLLGILEFIGAVGILIYLLSEKTWAKFLEVQKVVNSVIEDKEKKEGVE